MPIVVSDTSPLRALDHLGHLALLSRLFEGVLIPPTVRDELLRPRRRFRPVSVDQIPGAVVRAPAHEEVVAELLGRLGRAEAEAIALAAELNAAVLIDERAGRLVAAQLGLQITGVVGLLVEAKARGLIPVVMPLLERLRGELGFFLSRELLQDVRRQSGESG